MKKTLLFVLFITITFPLIAGIDCLDNSQHLRLPYDDKEWHSAACNCNCATIKGSRCIECNHLQNAHTYTIITTPKKNITKKITHSTYVDPKLVFEKLVMRYTRNKYGYIE
ncbi:MAG TPA: hypothetical protein VLB80_02515 [Candidatus Babeliales bacterium]|nr:hypothetical protein [Candidatus Babeliales bacterium]